MTTLTMPQPLFVPSRRRAGTVERAFELARSGECCTVAEIEKRLSAEFHESVYEHLSGLFIRGQLREAIAAAGAAPKRAATEDRPC